MDGRSVVASFFACWGVQDPEFTAAHFHEQIVYTIHIAAEASPFSGTFRGREACRDLAYAVLAEFDYLQYDPTILSVDGNIVRARVDFEYRHRLTGGVIAGTRRLLFEIKDDLIFRLDSFDDAPRFEAFMRLTHQRLMSGQLASPPRLPKREKQGSNAE